MHYQVTDLLADESVKASWYPERFTCLCGKGLDMEGGCGQEGDDQCVIRGMQVLSLDDRPGERTTVKINTGHPGCLMNFVLAGEITSVYIDGQPRPFSLASGQHNLVYTSGFEFLIDIVQPFKVVLVHISEQFVADLLDHDFQDLQPIRENILNKQTAATANRQVSPGMTAIIASLMQANLSGQMRHLLFQSKIMELLYLQLEQLEQSLRQDLSTSLKSYDVDKIYHAKKLVEENIQKPCSLIELAHKAGLNDFKLKKGFKEIVGNTVFGYLFELRMERAHALLLARKTVSEVAWQTGYKNPHHFTAAFKKKFGFLPSQLNR